MYKTLHLLLIVFAVGMAASTQPLWLPKEGIQSGNQSGYEGQQTLVAAGIPKSGSTNIAFSKLFSRSPKVLLGITSLESAFTTRYTFSVSLISAAADHFTTNFTIGNETSMNTLRASYLAVEQLVQNMWVNAQQQMESLTSCRLFIYSVALLASGSGTRSVAVTFSYVTQTGRNTTTDTKMLTFTTGISMTTNSSLSYSVASLFVNSQSYTITLAVQNGCSLTSFSFDTLLVDQTAMQSSLNSFVDMG